MIRRIFRPVYGDTFEVRPTRWWSRKDRRTARLAAAVINEPSHVRLVTGIAQRQMTDRLLYGSGFTHIEWTDKPEQ